MSESAGGSNTSRRRFLLTGVATVLGSSLVTFAGVELFLRATGRQPRRPVRWPEVGLFGPDPSLGWRPVPGHYQLPPLGPGGVPFEITFRADGARVSGPLPPGGRPEVLLLGCSITMGSSISNDQTYGWRLQELRPDVEVVNRAVEGYGTLQSLMVLENVLARGGPKPGRVLYGFIDHAQRNVATPDWLWTLSFSKTKVATPYCTLTGRQLERHPPAAYPWLPFHEQLAAVELIENNVNWRRAAHRRAMAVPVTKLLLSEMAALCRTQGIGFSLVVLHVSERVKEIYVPYALEHGIDVIDCNIPKFGRDGVVPGDLHPNGKVHRAWGECIAAALAEPSRLPPR